MVFEPTFRLIAPLAFPDATAVPFTVMLAVASAAVGVSVMLAVPFGTLCV
jgi:hypothetical protein